MPGCPEPRRRHRGLPPVAALALLALGLAAPRAGSGYADGPPPRNTGGFGETTCALCHRGGAPDPAGGGLRIVAPASYTPGREHLVEVALDRPGLRRAGFQLSVRFAAGDAAGKQAGALAAEGDRVQTVTARQVTYAAHTRAGTAVAAAGAARWQVRWTAPASGGTVVFHAAANASNDDDSELGDAIYTAVVTVEPRGGDG